MNLVKSGLNELREIQKFFGDQTNLVSRKGVYPYDYMDGISKFDETQLPPKSKFYSKLNDSGISDEEYFHAQIVANEFKMKNMGDYHHHYPKSDVLLLTDVFEEFRNVYLKSLRA